ncbi:IP6K [Lepeophtheirus salmonis]|uniref:Kinase n=1 Tax=Lepeophtheirus salmonis TaxID=72036 RepID=A0A7R8D2I4_LEPSM|nr:IP6K [Lepeophtheirus salmonis]CAF3003433.1 IP6K [Lepeophtheirus salmonis]
MLVGGRCMKISCWNTELDGPVERILDFWMLEEKDGERRSGLEPFLHQVGGHFPLVSLDDFTLCKPLNFKELRFYQSLPDVISIDISPLTLSYHLHRPIKERCEHLRLLSKSRILNPNLKYVGLKKDDESIEMSPESYCNPWALKIHRNHIKALARSSDYYLLLENLVHKHRNPCVIDLKVGTRQYSDDVSPSKKQTGMSGEKISNRVKSKDIDIYGDLKNNIKTISTVPKTSASPLLLQEYASVIRKGICELITQAKSMKGTVEHVVETGKAHTGSALVTLREEDNLPAQIVSRGRFIKRTFYTSLGLLDVVYHFADGVIKEDLADVVDVVTLWKDEDTVMVIYSGVVHSFEMEVYNYRYLWV